MKKATIEILHEGETIFGSRTAGEYFVREYKMKKKWVEVSTNIFTMLYLMYENIKTWRQNERYKGKTFKKRKCD